MQAMIVVRNYLDTLVRLHRDLARDFAAAAGYWRVDPEAIKHAAAAEVLSEHLAEVDAAIASATGRAEVAA